MRLIFAISFLTIFLVLNAEAESDSLKIYNMSEVVVTATRIPQELKNIPQRIDVIPFYRLQSNPALSADDALNQVSGVLQFRSSGILSKRTLVSLRGMGDVQGRTLIMLDGIPLNKASTGYANLNRISPDLIQRIEIVKGPGSSLYGANAMGGVVNIITQEPLKSLEGSSSFIGGSLGTFMTHGYIGGKTKNLSAAFYGDYGRSDGYNTYPIENRNASTIPIFLKEYSFGSSLTSSFSSSQRLQFSAYYYDGKRGNGTRYFPTSTNEPSLDLYNRFRELDFMTTYKIMISGFHLTFSANFSQEKYSQLNAKGSSLYDVDCIRRDWQMWAHGYKQLTSAITLSGGAELRGGYVNGKDIYRTSTDVIIDRGKSIQFGLWLQNEFKFRTNFRLVPSLRLDIARVYDGGFFTQNATSISNVYAGIIGKLENNTWAALSPKICMQYNFTPQNRLFFNASMGFRPGNLEDMVWAGIMRGVLIQCNTHLKPEHVATFEIGGDFLLANAITISPSIFYTRGWDYIFDSNTGDSILIGNRLMPVFRKENIGQVAIYGAELDMDASLSNRLNIFGNLTYNYTEVVKGKALISGSDVDLHGNRLSYVPRLKLAVGYTWRNPYFCTNMSYVFYSRQNTDAVGASWIKAFGVIDAKLWHEFTNRFIISLNCRNVLDKRFIDNGQLSIGRMIFGEVKMMF